MSNQIDTSSAEVYSWDTEELDILCENAKKYFEEIGQIRENYNTVVTRLFEAWKGDASEAHVEAMKTVLNNLEAFEGEFEEFKTALDEIAEIYKTAENNINTNISDLANTLESSKITSVTGQ